MVFTRRNKKCIQVSCYRWYPSLILWRLKLLLKSAEGAVRQFQQNRSKQDGKALRSGIHKCIPSNRNNKE